MKLKALGFLYIKQLQDTMFSSRPLLICNEKPWTDWPFHPAEYNCINACIPNQHYSVLYCMWKHMLLHALTAFFIWCMHVLMSWEGLSIHVYSKCVAVRVWPPQMHSTYYTPAGPACFPLWDLTTSWGVNSQQQNLGFTVQTWPPFWDTNLCMPKPKVSLLVCLSVVVTKSITAKTCQTRKQGFETGEPLKSAAQWRQKLCLNRERHPRIDKHWENPM